MKQSFTILLMCVSVALCYAMAHTTLRPESMAAGCVICTLIMIWTALRLKNDPPLMLMGATAFIGLGIINCLVTGLRHNDLTGYMGIYNHISGMLAGIYVIVVIMYTSVYAFIPSLRPKLIFRLPFPGIIQKENKQVVKGSDEALILLEELNKLGVVLTMHEAEEIVKAIKVGSILARQQQNADI